MARIRLPKYSSNRFLWLGVSAAAARGWPVFPLRPRAKTPAINRWPDRASTDVTQINRWWRRRLRMELRTSAAMVSRVWVCQRASRSVSAEASSWVQVWASWPSEMARCSRSRPIAVAVASARVRSAFMLRRSCSRSTCDAPAAAWADG
ncbi:bifunctional DNA primase/polymerase [Nocardia cyriacigeorgica]|uniref:bifunctional DNA primase/polymerase n=1 Tax=Nocardia cyriacigeorgica TaxID=135487 RepID=UPI003CC7F2B0